MAADTSIASSQIDEVFGSHVFNKAVQKERLSRATYKKLQHIAENGGRLTEEIANEVAEAMKEWALEHGATYYAHWFQPLNGITSEKHNSFLHPLPDGRAIARFSGKELIQGETDGSSFPNGGLRATFEARGYTIWDPASPAFIRNGVLCIPTAMMSYTQETLDKRVPMLRSQVALAKQAKRLLGYFGREPKTITVNVGPEQEYFIITEKDFAQRPDLINCGRTLFGRRPVKGQQLSEHYYGTIRPAVDRFMKDANQRLWELGIPVITKHNEVAPCQHELAPQYEPASIAIDHNLLTMTEIKEVAGKHGLTCLLHEKPFDFVNGSGKHSNWSLSADGKNLLDPSDTPEDNLLFLVILTCVISAVDKHQDLLRASIASAGNDQRLGADEAPPAIISMFLGDDLFEIVEAIIEGRKYKSHGKELLDAGVPTLADAVLGTTDRNRTSPFAFTGNKFEFRMPGSQENLSGCNMVLNTAVAEGFDLCATAIENKLQKAESVRGKLSARDKKRAVSKFAFAWIKRTLKAHRRILFNGNGYSAAWEKEAKARGLLNLKTTADALPYLIKPQNILFFNKYKVMDEAEVTARYVATAQQYAFNLDIEASCMVYMARHFYLPAIQRFSADLAMAVKTKKELRATSAAEVAILKKTAHALDAISAATDSLEAANKKAGAIKNPQTQDNDYKNKVLPAMAALREEVDAMEECVGREYWPFPSYNRMLHYVKASPDKIQIVKIGRDSSY